MINKIFGLRTITLTLVMILMLSCALPFSLQQAFSPTPTTSSLNNGAGGNVQNGPGSGSNGGGNGQNGAGGGGGGSGAGGTGNGPSTQITLTPNSAPLPYIVKQIESLGHETISGQVCNLTLQFTVNAIAPEVSWIFTFSPHGADLGSWVYAYSIPKAGETHDAAGTYTISQVSADGTLQLMMTGKDHVMFKGYDGSPAVNYKFALVPSQSTSCPTAP